MAEITATSWTLIAGAAAGSVGDRDHFVRRYAPVVRAFLLARWRGLRGSDELDDAVQEVFLECLKDGGALEKVESRRAGGFRAYLFGITRHVTLRCEERRAKRPTSEDVDLAALDQPAIQSEDAERAFERAWALSIVQAAIDEHERSARRLGGDDVRRFEVLRARFGEGLPIRDIATRMGLAAEIVHRDYARARKEFSSALRQVVAGELPLGASVDEECAALLGRLGT